MTKILLALVAAASLAACDNQDHTIVVEPGNQAATAVNTVGVVLPPSITSSRTYRCKDNSVVYIDWLSDGNARFRTDKNVPSVPVTIGAPGTPSLAGTATDATVTFNGQVCRHG